MAWYWLLTTGLAVMSVAMAGLWLRQLRTQNAGPVDVAWSAGIGLISLLFAMLAGGEPPRKWLVASLTGIWSLRLVLHLRHRVRNEIEDGRYRAIRAEKGAAANQWFFWFYQFQAVLVSLFVIPPLAAMIAPAGALRAWDFIGAGIGLVAILGESAADRQLRAFRSDPANHGKTCRSGWWHYTRHPNYFFEWIHWFAYVAIAGASPFGWITLLGPVLMLVFLFKITGIPPTEARALESRGDDYRDYQNSTSVFFPWFPKERRT